MARAVNKAERGRRTSTIINFDLRITSNEDHENQRNLDLDLAPYGDDKVIELRDPSFPYPEAEGVIVNVNLAVNDDSELVVQRKPERKNVKEIGALVVALFLLTLTIPERTRSAALPGLGLVGGYYFGRSALKRK